MKMFYLPELLIYDAWVTKVSVKLVRNSPTSTEKRFCHFSDIKNSENR